jgi:hypothetical protein
MSARTTERADPSVPDWSSVLVDAVTKPGLISDAYRRFWNYSVGNQILALLQCHLRQIEPGPIHTYLGWRDLGRQVKKGEKALVLCMPVTVKRRKPEAPDDVSSPTEGSDIQGEGTGDSVSFTRFIYRPHWFVLAQTEGAEYVPKPLPEWDEKLALERLKVERVSFQHTNGNTQGYARERSVAVSPIAFAPERTFFHELAHVVLGHTEELAELDDDDERTPRNVREVEAECVALIVCQSLGLGGEDFSRGYIQHWLGRESIAERSAQRIFSAANAILKAGYADHESADGVSPGARNGPVHSTTERSLFDAT